MVTYFMKMFSHTSASPFKQVPCYKFENMLDPDYGTEYYQMTALDAKMIRPRLNFGAIYIFQLNAVLIVGGISFNE